jgi:hypothetical protein
MATNIKHPRSGLPGKAPNLSQVDLGQIAINTADGKMYLKQSQKYVDDNEVITEESIIEFTSTVAVKNTLYIQKNGNDRNEGTTWSSAFSSFEKAIETATERNELTVIDVGPGVYYTAGHLDVPDDCVIKATHRTVFIKPIPGFEERNVFRLGSGCFIEGFVFEDWRLDDLDNPTEGFAACFRPGALITRVPYVHKVVVRTTPYWTSIAPPLDIPNGNPLVGRGAGVILADAAVLDPDSIFPNIMAWGATPVTHNGIGYCAKNGGLINAINAISIWSHKHFYALSGGQIVLSACSTQFGDYTMVSDGSRQIISPTEVSVSLTEQVTASNQITLNKTTIIDNMWNELVSQNFISAEFESVTKRDAGLFLQSIGWALRSANEKPVLDFAKGFFNTLGERTFTPAAYNFDKSFRDASLLTEAVIYDILFDSNFRSIKAARAYYRANSANLLATFKTETLLAINNQKTTLAGYLTGTSATRSNALFDEIINIVDNGEASASAYSLTDPTSFDTGYFNARRLLVANSLTTNTFIQDEIIAWINVQIAAKTAPFEDFVFNETLCRRDTGLIVDAVSYDMMFGSNFRSIVAGRAYLRSQAALVTASQLAATVGALTTLKTLMLEVVAGNTVAVNSVTSNMDLIIDIIQNGISVIPVYVLPEPTNITDGYKNAIAIIKENSNFIKAEIIQHLEDEFPSLSYSEGLCRRDVGYILDSVVYDLTYGGNLESIVSAKSYYDHVNLSFVIGNGQLTASASAYTYLKTLIYQIATSAVTTPLQTVVSFIPASSGNEGSVAAGNSATALVDVIVDFITDETLAAAVTPSTSWVESSLTDEFSDIVTAKATMIDDVITYIDTTFVNFVYNEALCRRDVGFIVEALTYDLTYGGDLETYNAAISYFVGATSQFPTDATLQTVAAMTRLKSVLGDILQGNAIVKSTGNNSTQDTSGTAGSLSAALFAQSRIDNIIFTINNNGVAPPKIYPLTDWPDTEFQNSFNTITANSNIISRDVSKYTAIESKTLIGAFMFSWEYMRDQINILPLVDATAEAIVNSIVDAVTTTIVNPAKVTEPSTITSIGHTWVGIMAGVALTKLPPARNSASIEESILELSNGIVIASGQDDEGSALFIGGMKIDADTGELSGPPFEQAVNRIATRASIARSF